MVNSATISWLETYNVDLTVGATVPREFTVELWDFTDTLLLGTIDSQLIGILGSQVEIDWTAFGSDITSLLSAHTGESVTLAFTNIIPETFTGPGGFGLDSVSLSVDTAPVPEPSTMLLLGSGLIGLIGYNYRRLKQEV